jgi:hypothetical protein
VFVYYQLFDKTISTKMWETLRYKKDVIDQILIGKPNKTDEIIKLIISNDEKG